MRKQMQYTWKKGLVASLFFSIIVFQGLFVACTHKPSKVEQMRMEKAAKDSTQRQQARQTLAYSDSLLQVLTPQVDSLMKFFRYEKNESYEDHGTYVHKLLQTTKNDRRCYLQAYVTDDHHLVLQSFYYGEKPIHQQMLRLSVDDLYQEAEGTNHSFEAEGWHEVMSIPEEDAMRLLSFVSAHLDERVRVLPKGKSQACYYLQKNEKEALACTYQFALVMRDIATLERAIHVASLQEQKYQQRDQRSAQDGAGSQQ